MGRTKGNTNTTKIPRQINKFKIFDVSIVEIHKWFVGQNPNISLKKS